MPDRPHTVPVRRGDTVELVIEAMADGPDAIARVDGYVVLVPGVLPGERVRAEITSAAHKFGRARVRAITARSPARTEPRCQHFLHCGGCQLQHQRYEDQLLAKRARVEKELRFALGDGAPPVLAPVPAPSPYGQRHKVALQLCNEQGRLRPALHRLRDQDLVVVRECPAAAPPALRLALTTVDALDRLRLEAFEPEHERGLLRSVLVRLAAATRQAHLIVVATEPVPELQRLLADLHDAGATTISSNENQGPVGQLLGPRTEVLSGPRRIDEQIGGITYCISPDAFFQTSPAGAKALVDAVTAWLHPTGQDVVADLYCGGGLFALPLAQRAREVFGIEGSAVAVADATAAAKRNRLRNARFLQGPVAQVLRRCADGTLPRPDVAVLDPPRAGAEPEALAALAALAPRRIAYVACDVESLARDLGVLAGHGYRVASVQPVDMFPQTAHVEAVACLERHDASPVLPRTASG